MQTFSSDSFILNFVQNLPVIVSKNEEEFGFSISNVATGMQKNNTLDFLEEISYFRSDPFTLLDLELLTNSYMIACTNTQNFEEENCASIILMEHTLGYDMNLFGSNIILFQKYLYIHKI